MSDERYNNGGIILTGALFLIFLVLKLTGHIDWSWWWVTAPLWGSVLVVLAIFVAILFGGSLILAGAALLNSIFNKKK